MTDDFTFGEYQRAAARTANHDAARDTQEKRLANFALGIAGEAAEVTETAILLGIAGGRIADTIKKHLFHDKPLDDVALDKEIGDVLWYAAMLCECRGRDLGEVARWNLHKLQARYPDGFNTADANARRDEQEPK